MKKLFDWLNAAFTQRKNAKMANELQDQFDSAIEEVEALMAQGNIEASGQALLKAEALRKKISTLNQADEA